VVQELSPEGIQPAWPPTLGSEWQTGVTLRDRLFLPVDTAFQLTTYGPPDPTPGDGPEAKVSMAMPEDLARLASSWLSTAQ
jgi:hypothetical protein